MPERYYGSRKNTDPLGINIYGEIPALCNHLLIAGATGAGKSVVLHGIIAELLKKKNRPYLAFIDLKKVEMAEYKHLYNLFGYADTAFGALCLLEDIRQEMASRYNTMERQHLKKWAGKEIYIIIDEFAELLIDTKKKCNPLVQSIAQLGRASGIHLVLATQCPLKSIIDTPIKLNFDGLLALRTRSAQDSRNIIGVAGAEKLPRNGKGIFVCPSLLAPEVVDLPLPSENARERLIKMLSL